MSVRRLRTRLDSSLRRVYGVRSIEAALSKERVAMMLEVRNELQADAETLGITLDDVRISRTDLTQDVSERTFNRMRAERLAEAELLRAQGTEEGQRRRAIADRQVVELTADAQTWGRGPMRDTHSSFKAMVDSPVWRLVQALSTLVTPDGNTPAIDGFMATVPPLGAEDKALIATAAKKMNEQQYKVGAGAMKWIDDLPFLAALERLESQPTVNIEGIYGGYTGPGGKTVLPHKASAKLDIRLVPGQKADTALAQLKAHLEKRGYGDIEINKTGGYDPTRTKLDAPLIQAQIAVLKRADLDPVVWPWLAGSYPGYIFTQAPLSLAAGHFGLGNGGGQHAPDEYLLIESTNPKIRGYDGAALSYVEYLYELAK